MKMRVLKLVFLVFFLWLNFVFNPPENLATLISTSTSFMS